MNSPQNERIFTKYISDKVEVERSSIPDSNLSGVIYGSPNYSVAEAFLRDYLNKLTFAVKFRTFSHVAVPSTQHSMGLVGLADA